MQNIASGETGSRIYRISPYYFLRLCVNLQLSQNERNVLSADKGITLSLNCRTISFMYIDVKFLSKILACSVLGPVK